MHGATPAVMAVLGLIAGAIGMNEAQRFVVCTGGGDRFDVIVGHRLNDKPLSLADANRLARRASASTISVVGNLVNGTKP